MFVCIYFFSYMGMHGFETWSVVPPDQQQEDSNGVSGDSGGRVAPSGSAGPCWRLPGLSAGQRRICALYLDHMPAVGSGAKDAIGECQHQFKHRRWNCTANNDTTVFGPLTKIGYIVYIYMKILLSAKAVYFCNCDILYYSLLINVPTG